MDSERHLSKIGTISFSEANFSVILTLNLVYKKLKMIAKVTSIVSVYTKIIFDYFVLI